jgi:ribose transport system permease protein
VGARRESRARAVDQLSDWVSATLRRAAAIGDRTMTMGGLAERASAGGLFRFARGLTGPLVGLVALCVFLSFSTDTFLSLRNILNVMDQITVLGVMAVGMTLVILIGGIDLSVGSALALSGMVLGYLDYTLQWPFGISIIVALVVSALCGLASGLMVTRLRMPTFITTLAMMSPPRSSPASICWSTAASSAGECASNASAKFRVAQKRKGEA